MKISWKFFVQKMIFKTFDGARLVHHTEPSITEPSISEMMKVVKQIYSNTQYLSILYSLDRYLHVILDVKDKRSLTKVGFHHFPRGLESHRGVQIWLQRQQHTCILHNCQHSAIKQVKFFKFSHLILHLLIVDFKS